VLGIQRKDENDYLSFLYSKHWIGEKL